VRADNVARLRTRLVLQGANIPFTAEAEQALHARGVIVVPDFVANAGGVICAAMEYAGASRAIAFDAIAERVGTNTAMVLSNSKAGGQMPRRAAAALAESRVRAAMLHRRFAIM
jgi:glutamate dehydrogenase (NAD(P)+)